MLFCRTIEYAQKIIQNHAGIFQINAACFDHVKNLIQTRFVLRAVLQRRGKAFFCFQRQSHQHRLRLFLRTAQHAGVVVIKQLLLQRCYIAIALTQVGYIPQRFVHAEVRLPVKVISHAE